MYDIFTRYLEPSSANIITESTSQTLKRDRAEYEKANSEIVGFEIPELSFLENKPKKLKTATTGEAAKYVFDAIPFLVDTSFTPPERQTIVSLIKENGGHIVENEKTCKFAVFLASTFSQPVKCTNVTKVWIQTCCSKQQLVPIDSSVKYRPIFLKRDVRAIHSKTASFTVYINPRCSVKEDAEYIIKLLGGKIWDDLSSNVDVVLVDDEEQGNNMDDSFKMQIKRFQIPLVKSEWIYYCANVGHFTNIESFQILLQVPSTSTSMPHFTPPLLTLDIDTNEALQLLEQTVKPPAQQTSTKKPEKPLERKIFILSGFSNLEKKKELVTLIKRNKGEVFESFTAKCNCLITDRPSKTEKFLCALISKKWILRQEYVFKSVEEQSWVNEAEFEWTPQYYQSLFLKAANKNHKDQIYDMIVAMTNIKREPKYIFEDWKVVLLVEQSQPYFKNLMLAGKATVVELNEALTLNWLQKNEITHLFYDPLKEKIVLNSQMISTLENSGTAVKLLSFDFILSYICTFTISSKEQQKVKIQQLMASFDYFSSRSKKAE